MSGVRPGPPPPWLCWESPAKAKLRGGLPRLLCSLPPVPSLSIPRHPLLCLARGEKGGSELQQGMNGGAGRGGLSLVSDIWTRGPGWSTKPGQTHGGHHPSEVGEEEHQNVPGA